MHDTATLSGLVDGKTTPSISFSFYLSADCTGAAQAITNTGAGDSADAVSATVGPLGAGSYSFKAAVPANDDYLGDDSDCEPFTVAQAQLDVTTAVHDVAHTDVTTSSVALGSTVHDTAQLTGDVSGFTPPAIAFSFYLSGDCTGTAQAITNTGAGDGADAVSDTVGPLGAGSYSFNASIAGDTNYAGDNSDCEPFSVTQAQLAVTTAVHDAAHTDVTNTIVALGTTVHDTAQLSGEVSGFTPPQIAFSFYLSGDCTGTAQTITNTGPGETADAVSGTVGPLNGAGSYSFKASIAGDTNYAGDDSDCEPFSVGQAQLSVSTAVHDEAHLDVTNGSVPLGTTVHDTANLSGVVTGATPPAISFSFYLSGDCSGTAQAVTNTGAGDSADAVSATVGPLGAGSYSFKAAVPANGDYLGDDSDCEPFTVLEPVATPTPSPTPDPTPSPTPIRYTIADAGCYAFADAGCYAFADAGCNAFADAGCYAFADAGCYAFADA